MRLLKILAAGLLLGALPLGANAGADLGGSIGSARVNNGDFQGSDTSYKLYLGSSYHEIIGGEVGYVNFGQLGGNGPDAQAWNLAATIGIPYVFDFMTPYGKAGAAWEEVKGGTVSSEYKTEKPFYGVGLRFGSVRSPLGARVEYERYTFRDQRLDLVSAGLEFRF